MNKPNTKKHILIVNQSPPYSSSNAKESLDIALAAGTFEQAVSVLFTGDACYQLLPNQAPEAINSKNLCQMLKALPIYGIDELLVDEQSLASRNVTHLDKSLTIRKISQHEVQELYRNSTAVFRF